MTSLPADRIKALANLPIAALATIGVSVVWFLLTWRYDLDLADEGFYWYGAQRVALGEVPIRDFMAYDIGRYYWASAFMHWLGQDGLFVARLSAAVYQCVGTLIGVYLSLLALQRDGRVRWIFAVLVALILTAFVTPYYKSYDHATSIMIVGICVLLLKTTNRGAWLFAGICLGLAAIVGRNHGVYGAVASLLTVLLLWYNSLSRDQIKRLYHWFIVGVVIGFSPTLIMMVKVDGFFSAFWDSIRVMFEYGGTNIPLPVPWPWTIGAEHPHPVRAFAVGVGFIVALAFPAIVSVFLLLRRIDLTRNTGIVVAAAALCAVPYAHFAFSRADMIHLTLGILPVVLGLLALGGYMRGSGPVVLAAALLAISLTIVPKGLFERYVFQRPYVLSDVGGETLWLAGPFFDRYSLFDGPLKDVTKQGERFLALPDTPGLHAIFRTKMSVWENYALFPASPEFEQSEIDRIESMLPDVIILSDHPLDGNPELRYSRTHPMTYQWMTTHYEPSSAIHVGDLRSYSRRQSLSR